MIGFPFENDDSLTEETIRLNKGINPDFVQFTIYYPFPGTRLYQRCIDLDLIDPKKSAGVTTYYEESILKGISLKKKLAEINSLFNPYKLQFSSIFLNRKANRILLFVSRNRYIGTVARRLLPSPIKNIVKKLLFA